jgi:hypothetical protein
MSGNSLYIIDSTKCSNDFIIMMSTTNVTELLKLLNTQAVSVCFRSVPRDIFTKMVYVELFQICF